jgi:hypothetical protein
MYKFQQKLKNLKQKLKSWNKHTFGNIFDSQKELRQQMEEIQRMIRDQGLTDALKEQELQVSQHLETRKKQEEILWKQKSRISLAQGRGTQHKFLPSHCYPAKALQQNHAANFRGWRNHTLPR